MIVLRNARVIPELTPGFNDDRADIIIEDDIPAQQHLTDDDGG